MNQRFLRQVLRRALLVSMTVPALAEEVGCGGNVAVDGPAGLTGSSSTSSGSGTGGSNAGCALASTTPISSTGCTISYELAGPASDCSPGPNGKLTASECAALCPPNTSQMAAVSCSAADTPSGGQLTCQYYVICGTGRRPPGLARTRRHTDAAPTAAFLAAAAHLEAASVVAFEQLAGELASHGAPRRLVSAARRAAREEVGHARVMRRFALRAGAAPEPVEVVATRPRSLEAIAVENAVEGCVRETFGAVMASRQAECARSPALRRAMKRIAREETGHAVFAFELWRWLDARLAPRARRRVLAAQASAIAELARDVAREPDEALVRELGLPAGAQSRAAVAELSAAIWRRVPAEA